MTLIVRQRGFLYRLRQPVIAEQLPAVELIIANARTILAAVSLIAIWLDPTEPSSYEDFAYALMVGFVVYSILLHILLRRPKGVSSRIYMVIHGVDIVWTAVIMTFTAGPNSAFFLFFIFTVVFAAYRWDLRRTMITALVTVVLIILEGTLLLGTIGSIYLEGEFQLNRLIMRVTYVLLAAFLVGYVADREKTLRAESMTISRAVSKVQSTVGFRTAVCAVLEDAFPIFGVNEAWIVVRNLEREEGGGLWKCTSSADRQKISALWIGLEPEQVAPYLFASPYTAWHAVRHHPKESFDFFALDDSERAVVRVSSEFARDLPVPESRLSYLAVAARFGDEWAGRFYLLDPAIGSDRAPALRFLSTLVHQISPGMYNAYLVSRMRSRIGAIERSRIARELHDGVIQSMISLELETAALRLRSENEPSVLSGGLRHLQERIRQEVITLREIMEQMRPVETGDKHFLDYIGDQVDRFQRHTGIEADFLTELKEVELPTRVRREVGRIVQEALVNVRKHSKASHVTVRMAMCDDDHLKLVVEDNGQGFQVPREPAVIKERVRVIDGQLQVESNHQKGSRLTVTFPGKAQA